MTISLISSELPAAQRQEGWGVPLTGPVDQYPGESPRDWIDSLEAAGMLRHALAGLPLGYYERVQLHALAQSAPHAAGVVASLIWRARVSIPAGADSYWLGMATVTMRQVAACTEAAGQLGRALTPEPDRPVTDVDDADRLRLARSILPSLAAACGIQPMP